MLGSRITTVTLLPRKCSELPICGDLALALSDIILYGLSPIPGRYSIVPLVKLLLDTLGAVGVVGTIGLTFGLVRRSNIKNQFNIVKFPS